MLIRNRQWTFCWTNFNGSSFNFCHHVISPLNKINMHQTDSKTGSHDVLSTTASRSKLQRLKTFKQSYFYPPASQSMHLHFIWIDFDGWSLFENSAQYCMKNGWSNCCWYNYCSLTENCIAYSRSTLCFSVVFMANAKKLECNWLLMAFRTLISLR